MSGSENPVGCGVRAADDGCRTVLPGETALDITVFIVQGRDDVGVADSTPIDAAHEGHSTGVALGDHAPSGEPCTYKMAFLTTCEPRNCLVKGCRGQAVTWTAIQVHFYHWHFRDTVIILDEGNLPCPRCPWCDMLVP